MVTDPIEMIMNEVDREQNRQIPVFDSFVTHSHIDVVSLIQRFLQVVRGRRFHTLTRLRNFNLGTNAEYIYIISLQLFSCELNLPILHLKICY